MDKTFCDRKAKDKRTPSEYLAMNLDPTKPNIGNKITLEDNILSVRSRISRLNSKMARMARDLRESETINQSLVSQYVDLNDQLKGAKVYEAELVHLRNML